MDELVAGLPTEAIAEIDRILKPRGWLRVAVPSGYSFDDGLYRLVFNGGGHVNRFTFESLLRRCQSRTGHPTESLRPHLRGSAIGRRYRCTLCGKVNFFFS